MDIIFLIYGLSFLGLALVVAIWPKDGSQFELASVSRWLAAFALVHGLLEWTDLWREVRGDTLLLAQLRPFLLLGSYVLLLEFGRRLLLASLPAEARAARRLLDPRLHLLLLAGVAAGSLAAAPWSLSLAIWSRYLFGFVGALLAGIAFLLYCAQRIEPTLPAAEARPIARSCRLAGHGFIAYAIFGGLVVPAADWAPAAWLNQDSFLALTGLPVQIFRAACAVLIAAAVGHVLKVFHLEGRQRLQGSLDDAQIALVEVARLSRRNQLLLKSVGEGIFGVDETGKVTFINPVAQGMLGFAEGELMGQPVCRLVRNHHGHGGGHHDCPIGQVLRDGQARHAETEWFRRRDDSLFPVELRVAAIEDEGRRVGAVVVFQDISERQKAEAELRLAHEAFTNSREAIMVTDENAAILDVNPAFSRLTGYSREEATGSNPRLLSSGRQDAVFYQAMWQALREKGRWEGELWNRRKNGQTYVQQAKISAVRDPAGKTVRYVCVFSDVTLEKESQQRIEHMAYYDPLTNLPNRALLADRLRQAIAQADRRGNLLAVCYLDLDGFKPINDTWGHDIGDQLLIDLARRLQACVRAGDTVARLGGDEFVILLGDTQDAHEVELAVRRVLAAVAAPFSIGPMEAAVTASMGVTIYPNDGQDTDTLIRHADQAMYAAKQSGRNRFHLFDPESDRRVKAHREIISRVEAGLLRGQFRLHYQPKVDMRRGRVVGLEALIRWQHPDQGLLMPAVFLPAVDNSDCSVTLGDWVLREALRQLAQWADDGLELSVSVNISGRHLQHPDFVARLAQLLAEFTAVPAQRLELEILETTAMDDLDAVSTIIAACSALGVSFALDDFGTGYSSLTYFRRLPTQLLKIDQSFVRDMLVDADDLAIVEGVIGLAHTFQRQVIAEGVETIEHGVPLLRLGCDLAQGYGIARPMPPEQIPAWVATWRIPALWQAMITPTCPDDEAPGEPAIERAAATARRAMPTAAGS